MNFLCILIFFVMSLLIDAFHLHLLHQSRGLSPRPTKIKVQQQPLRISTDDGNVMSGENYNNNDTEDENSDDKKLRPFENFLNKKDEEITTAMPRLEEVVPTDQRMDCQSRMFQKKKNLSVLQCVSSIQRHALRKLNSLHRSASINKVGTESWISRYKRNFKRKIAAIIVASNFFFMPGVASARSKELPKGNDILKSCARDFSTSRGGSVDIVAVVSTVADVEITSTEEDAEFRDVDEGDANDQVILADIDTNDFAMAVKQGNLLNRVGFVGVCAIIVKTCIGGGGNTKIRKRKIPQKSAPTKLELGEDNLSNIMSKLDNILREKGKKSDKDGTGASESLAIAEEADVDENFTDNRESLQVSFASKAKEIEDGSDGNGIDNDNNDDNYDDVIASIGSGTNEKLTMNRTPTRRMSLKFKSNVEELNSTRSSVNPPVASDLLDNDRSCTEDMTKALRVDSDNTLTNEESVKFQTFLNDNEKGMNENATSGKPLKKSFVDRIFKRYSSTLSTDLGALLMREGDGQLYTAAVAKSLVKFCPEEIFAELRDENLSLNAAEELVVNAKEATGITDQVASDMFAEVSNCVVIALVDRACSTLSGDESYTVDALDAVVDFMLEAGSIYEKISGGCKPSEAVIYNGSAKKKKIDELYIAYARKAMSLENILGGFGDLTNSFTDGNDDERNSKSSKGTVIKVEEAEEKAERGIARLNSLVQILSIKENKKEQLDMKIMRELLMNISNDRDGMPDLSGLLGTAGSNSDEMPTLDKIMKQMDDVDPKQLDEMKAMMEDMPDFTDMNAEEMALQSKQAFTGIKEALDAGEMNRTEILEFETMMGSDIESLLKVMKQAERGGALNDKAMKDMLGSDVTEMMAIFQRLVDIKNLEK